MIQTLHKNGDADTPSGEQFPSDPRADDRISPHRLGRRGEARRHAIEEAAHAVFLEKGYERATLNEILTRSGGSRTTFYELFGSKEGLFQAVLEEMTDRISARLNASADGGGTPEEALIRYGISLLDAIMEPETQAICRILVAEGRLFPAVAADFFRIGPDATRQSLADYLSGLAARGLLVADEPLRLAEILLGMIVSNLNLFTLICPDRIPTAEGRRSQVTAAVRLFLKAVAV